jgi:hypothetical protein
MSSEAPKTFLPDEFAISQYQCEGPGWALRIVHTPSGISKLSRTYLLSEDKENVPKPHQLKQALMNELIAELREKGIPPQPPKIRVKKIGKPRWSKTDKMQDA